MTKSEPSNLPFLGIYVDVLRGGYEAAELTRQETEVQMHNRIVEPVEGWDCFRSKQWGADTDMIEEWFDAGDELQHIDTTLHDVNIEEPETWERAVSWFRSVLVTPRHA